MGIFFIKDASQADNNVYYDGKVLPRDAKKPLQLTGDSDPMPEQVNYNGAELPRQKKKYQDPVKDLTNNPSLVVIGGITLPADTAIFIYGQKVIAQSKILDGVSVIERISRQPYEIEFECVVRAQDAAGNYIFPQDALNNIWTNVWIPDTVMDITNTYLNKLGILQIVIESVTPTTIRGSKNIPLRLRAYENVIGQTIIVNPTTITGFTIGGAI